VHSWLLYFSIKMKIFSQILLFLLLINAAYSQKAAFTANANKKIVSLNDYFQLTFTIRNADAKSFSPPKFTNFKVLAGPSTSSSSNIQFINGKMSHSTSYSYTYTLQPSKVGKFTIGPASCTVKGKKTTSNSVKMEVVKGKSSPSGTQQSNTSSPTTREEDLILKVSVDKTNVYQGEQVTATYKIYTRVNISNGSISKMPGSTGFWANQIEMPQQLHFTQENKYHVATVWKVALFPQRSGELTVDPMEMDFVIRIKIQKRRRSIFDDLFDDPFFGGFGSYKDIKKTIKSNSVKIKVKPLPTINKPQNFNGAVGKYALKATLDKTETKSNEPLTLNIKISGEGNLKLIESPMIDELPADFETYEPKIIEKMVKGSSKIKGTKTFEYLLIPRRGGEYKLPPITFSYFDLSKKDYITLNSSPFTIKVEKGEGQGEVITATGISKEEVELLGQDVRFIKTGDIKFHKKGKYFFDSPAFFSLALAPFLLFTLFFFYRRRQAEIASDVILMKRRRATKVAKKRLAIAKKHFRTGEKKLFYDEVSKAIWGYLSDKLNISQSELSKEKVQMALKAKGVGKDKVRALMDIIDTSERALFSPSSDAAGMEKVYISTVQIISEIEV